MRTRTSDEDDGNQLEDPGTAENIFTLYFMISSGNGMIREKTLGGCFACLNAGGRP